MKRQQHEEHSMIEHTIVSLSAEQSVRFALAAFVAPPRPRSTPQARLCAGKPCPLCGETLTVETARWAFIVPHVHRHAPALAEMDRFTICESCASKRGAADLLDGPLAHPCDLLDRRRALLLGGAHHPTPWTDRGAITRSLTQRVSQPRATIVATAEPDGSAIVGWSERSGGDDTLGALATLLCFHYAAERIPDSDDMVTVGGTPAPTAYLWRVPRGLDALSALIEAGALLLPARPAQVTWNDFRTAWIVQWWSMPQQLERVDHHLMPIPDAPRERSASAGAQRMRARRARLSAR
jgi:hypothetical protein